MEMEFEKAIEFFLGKKAVAELGEKMEVNGNKTGFGKFASQLAFAGIALALFLLAAMIAAGIPVQLAVLAGICAAFAPLAFGLFWEQYRFEARRREIEKEIPGMLLQASVFPSGTPLPKIIEYVSHAGYGKLSVEFARTRREIRRGFAIEEAFGSMKKRNKSASLDRALNLLLQGYESGAEMSHAFREAAEDLLETGAILQERNSALIIEKYTLLAAGAVIVPLVLGLIVGTVSGFGFLQVESLGIGLSNAQRKELLDAALAANQIYIVEYCLLASAFVAVQEGNAKKAVLYAMALIPAAFAAYYFGRMIAG